MNSGKAMEKTGAYFSDANQKKVFVTTYTNEGLKIELGIGPLKFERSRRGGDFTSRKTPVATI